MQIQETQTKVLLPISALAASLIAFGLIYVGQYRATGAGFTAYVGWVSVMYAFCGFAIATASMFVKPSTWFYTGCSASMALVFCGVLMHQLVVIAGLISWGAVPTARLIAGYFNQIEHLEHLLPLSPKPILVVAAGLFALATVAHYGMVKHICARTHMWVVADPNRKKKVLTAFLLSSAVVLNLYHAYVYLFGYDDKWDEPFIQTSRSSRPIALQSIQIDDLRQAALEKLDGDARRQYVPNRSGAALPNIVMFTVDALRPDRLPVYGYGRNTAPFLSALMKRGEVHVVREARSACAESTCGILSLQTGKQIHELSRENFGLPEILRLHGYRRMLILSGDHTNFYDLKTLYGHADYFRDGTSRLDREGGDTSSDPNSDSRLLGHLEELPPHEGEPVFMQLHLMSVHGVSKRLPEFSKWTPQKSVYQDRCSKPEEVGNHYDNGVLAADMILEQSIAKLRRKGYVKQDSIVLVTADHGEALGEHGLCGHSKSVHEAVVRIPWIWIGKNLHADLAAATIQADLAPTVLGHLGLPIPKHWSGKDQSATEKSRRLTFHAQGNNLAVVDVQANTTLKIMYNRVDKEVRLFDIRNDRDEVRNIADTLDPAVKQGYVDELFSRGYLGVSR